MKKFKQLNKKVKIVFLCSVFLLFAISYAFAYFAGSLEGSTDAEINANTGTTDNLSFFVSESIRIHATLENFYEGHENLKGSATATATLKANNTTNQASGRYNVFFIIDNNDFEYTTEDGQAELLLKITDPNGKEVQEITGLKKVEDSFDITTRTGAFLVMPNYDIEATDATAVVQNWDVEVTLVNLNSDQNLNMGKSLNGRFYITTDEVSTYELAKVYSIDADVTHDTITANLKVSEGTEKINKYYYAIEEDKNNMALLGVSSTIRIASIKENLEYKESDEVRYTFLSLNENTSYMVYGYVKDIQGMISNVYQTSIMTEEYTLPKIESVEKKNITLNSISLKVNALNGSNDVVKYYYSKDNGLTYIASDENTFTFDNLLDTTEYKIKIKVEDSAGRFSTIYHENIATSTYINPSITNIRSTTTYQSIQILVEASGGSNEVSKYYFSKDDGATWSEGQTSNTYTFLSLAENETYSIAVKVEDILGRSSITKVDVATNAYQLPTVTSVSATTSFTSITLTATANNGDGEIVTYYFSKDNGSTWVSSSSNTYTFSNLNHGTAFYMKVKVVDSNGRESVAFSKNISTDIRYLSNYVKSLYSSQGANGLYYHSTSLGNSAGDNSYRYAGANPNNYVCFGATISPCPEENLYRIIGVFGNQVKLIKSDFATKMDLGLENYYGTRPKSEMPNYSGPQSSIYNYYWYPTGSSSATWAGSQLNTINLNKNYLGSLGTTWSDKIATTGWNVGNLSTANALKSNAKTAYNYEVGSNKVNSVFSSKVGLMYMSDYYYAATPTYWTYPGLNESDTTKDYRGAINNNWMYLGWYDWAITKTSDMNLGIFNVAKEGNGAVTATSSSNYHAGVRPVFNLVNTVTLKSGSGTKASPYYLDGITNSTSTINQVTTTSTYNSITVTIDSTIGSGTMKEYLISKDNGVTWLKSTSKQYTIGGLLSGTTYPIKVKGVDANNKETNVYTLNASTTSTLATKIRKLYTSQGANGIYYHDSGLANGARDNSYRYTGADPNNYVCFGSTASTCPIDNLYRIIGVFDDRIKLIKFDYAQDSLLGVDGDRKIGYAYSVGGGNYPNYKGALTNPNSYYWNYSNGENSLNNWSESRLNKVNLNTNFVNRIGSAWSSKIASSTWYVGGVNLTEAIAGKDANATNAYNKEVGADKVNTTYSAKIGLPYVSEFYYAATPTYWTKPGYTAEGYLDKNGNYGEAYDYRSAMSSNWMNQGVYDWSISRASNFSQSTFLFSSSGHFSWTYTYNDRAVRPTFTLDGNVLFSSGTGTKTSPYRISTTQSSVSAASITNISSSVTSSSITVTLSAIAGTNAISKFMFSKDGTNWYEAKGGNHSRYTFNGLNSNTTYTIRMKIVDANGLESSVWNRNITTSYVNPSVSNVTISNIGATSFTVNASATQGSASLKQYYFSKDGGSTWYSVSTSATSASYTFSSLASSTRYNIAVKVYDVNNYVSSVFSTTATTSAYVYPSVSSVSISNVTHDSFTVNAYASGGTNSLRYYYFSIDGGSSWSTVNTSSTSYSYTFDYLSPNTNYSVVVKVYDTNGYASGGYYTNVTTLSISLADYVDNLYEGQGYNELYYHRTSLSYGAQDNSLRYYGRNPDNYVCFGSHASTCPEDNLYRIIGLFGSKIKLIKYTRWDTQECWSGRASNTSNNWDDSYLKGWLNGMYLDEFSTFWQNMISRTYWAIENIAYDRTLWGQDFSAWELDPRYETRDYVGLPYVSDYAFACSQDYWTEAVFDYYNNGAARRNWLFTGVNYWTITAGENNDETAWLIDFEGSALTGDVYEDADVHPTFFLYNDVMLTGGSGTYSDPFRIE